MTVIVEFEFRAIVVRPVKVYADDATVPRAASVGGSFSVWAFSMSVPTMFGFVLDLPSHARHERPDSMRSSLESPIVKPSQVMNSSFVCIGPSSASSEANWMSWYEHERPVIDSP